LSTNPETETEEYFSQVYSNPEGDFIMAGEKIRRSSLLVSEDLTLDEQYQNFPAGGLATKIAFSNNSNFFFVAKMFEIATPSSPTGGDVLYRYHQTFSLEAPLEYTLSFNLGSMMWKYNTPFLLTSSNAALATRELFDATAIDASGIASTGSHAKEEPRIDLDITGPHDDRDVFVTIAKPRHVYSYTFTTGVQIHSRNLDELQDYYPYVSVRRVFALHNSDFVLVTSNWHKFVLWNFVDDSAPTEYNIGYNMISQVAVFPRTRTIAVSSAEMVKLYSLSILRCSDPLASSCQAFDSEWSLNCKTTSSAAESTIQGKDSRQCYCNPATPFYDYDTETCSSTQKCDDDKSNTCSGPEEFQT
jgi:hypothetical protein